MAACIRRMTEKRSEGIGGHRPDYQAGHFAVLCEAPLDEHLAFGRVERCSSAIDPERLIVGNLLVHRALLPSQTGDRSAGEGCEIADGSERLTHVGREPVPQLLELASIKPRRVESPLLQRRIG